MTKILSIIIVHFQSQKPLLNCLKSIVKISDKTAFEVIIVNNDAQQLTLPSNIKQKLAITLVNSPKNLGYGGGNNLGVKKAKGKYLWFLNPDTIVNDGVIDQLVKFLENNPQVGIVAPTITHENGSSYQIQGSTDLTPLATIFSHSFLAKLWPNNPIRRQHLLFDTDQALTREVGAAPGSVLMISRKLFNEVGQFDENFFLYYEEHDLCKRIRNIGKQVYILAKPKVIHIGGQSSRKSTASLADHYFKQSRFYYHQKHFGIVCAYLVEIILKIKLPSKFKKNHKK